MFEEACRFEVWPDVPMHVIAGCDDRFFPVDFQRRVARERMGLTVDGLPGGHLIALSNPRGLVDRSRAAAPRAHAVAEEVDARPFVRPRITGTVQQRRLTGGLSPAPA